MNNIKKYSKWLALAMSLTMPVAIGVATSQPAHAAQEAAEEDTLFVQSKNKIASELAAAGIISRQNAEIIKNATVKKSRKISIDVNYSDGKLSFKSSPAVMEKLQKSYPDNKTRVAEEYLLEVAAAVGEADMWLRMQGNGKVSKGVFTGWSDCVKISIKNLLLKQNISEKEATSALLSSGSLIILNKYVQWDNQKKVITLNEGLFAEDFGIATDAEIEALLAGNKHESSETTTANTPDSNSAVPEEMRTFWQNLKPLENKQDLQALKKITDEMCSKTTPVAEVVNIEQGRPIPFDQLDERQAKLAAQGNTCYTNTKATVQLTPEYVDFCDNVIIPKLNEFFTPLATDITRKKITVTVWSGEYKNWNQNHGNAVLKVEAATCFQFPNTRGLDKAGYFNVWTVKFKDAKAAFTATASTEAEAEVTVFHLPKAYSNFCSLISKCYHTWDVYPHYQDINDKWLFSGKHVRTSLPCLWYNDYYSFRNIDFGGHYSGTDSNFKNCVVSFNPTKVQYPYLKEEEEARKKAENEKLHSNAISNSLFLIFIILCIFGGMSGYGLYVLHNEYKRRWKELALPEGETVHLVDEDQLRPEFSAFYEWKEMLVWKSEGENEEDSMPYITNKQTVDKGYEVLYNLAALPDLNAHEITTLNLMGGDLNNAQKRYLGTSKWLLGAFTLCYLFFAIQSSVVPYAVGAWLGILSNISFIIALASIFISDLMPMYKFGNEEPILIRGARRILKAIGAGAWASAIFVATQNHDTLYEDSSGRVYVKKDNESRMMGCVMAIIIIQVLLILLPFLAFGNSLASFYRNYFSNK